VTREKKKELKTYSYRAYGAKGLLLLNKAEIDYVM